MRGSSWFAVVVTVCSTPAYGAVVVVSPNGPLATIQAGVDAAAAGDVVVVKAGTYSGAVNVPSDRDGLVLKAQGKVLLDARGPGGAALGGAIRVFADDVLVKGFTIRNAAPIVSNPGDGIVMSGPGGRVEQCTVFGCADAGIAIFASDVAVKNSKLSNNDRGIDIGAGTTGIVITKSTFESDSDRGVNLATGASVRVEKCKFVGGGAGVTGPAGGTNDDCVVKKCRFERVLGRAVLLNGANTLVEACVIKRVGNGMLFRGTNGVVRENLLDGVAQSSSAIDITAASGFLVEGNTFIAANGPALDLASDTSNCVVVDNVAKLCGTNENNAAIVAGGDGHQLEDNKVIDTAGDGYLVQGAGASLTECVALRCGRDGFDVFAGSVSVVLDDCVARLCAAEGLENSGGATVVNGGTFLKNRLDIANDGTLTLNEVTFATGGANVQPQIND